jgi:hypothetical protein
MPGLAANDATAAASASIAAKNSSDALNITSRAQLAAEAIRHRG